MTDENEIDSLRTEIRDLREDVSEIKQILLAIAPTVALSAGDTEASRYMLETMREQRLSKSWHDVRTSERALELMADRADELGASDLAGYLME
jgi:hypothetical protein